jgi:hypothetical protein
MRWMINGELICNLYLKIEMKTEFSVYQKRKRKMSLVNIKCWFVTYSGNENGYWLVKEYEKYSYSLFSLLILTSNQ